MTYGWNVAYTRFIAVTIGITAAWIISALPPTRSARKEIRRSYAGTVKQMGAMFCDIVSEMLDPYYVELPDSECTTRRKVLAMKRRLVKLKSRHGNIGFELSFKGVWPADRYAVGLRVISVMPRLIRCVLFTRRLCMLSVKRSIPC